MSGPIRKYNQLYNLKVITKQDYPIFSNIGKQGFVTELVLVVDLHGSFSLQRLQSRPVNLLASSIILAV